jgi:hypothetical protein
MPTPEQTERMRQRMQWTSPDQVHVQDPDAAKHARERLQWKPHGLRNVEVIEPEGER